MATGNWWYRHTYVTCQCNATKLAIFQADWAVMLRPLCHRNVYRLFLCLWMHNGLVCESSSHLICLIIIHSWCHISYSVSCSWIVVTPQLKGKGDKEKRTNDRFWTWDLRYRGASCEPPIPVEILRIHPLLSPRHTQYQPRGAGLKRSLDR